MRSKKPVIILFLVVIFFKYGANENNENITGIWKRLFVSKDRSTMSPYSLLMLNDTSDDVPLCPNAPQLNIEFCITAELMNWESNPPDKVAVTYTNLFGEILKIAIFNNSGEYGTVSRERWFNASGIDAEVLKKLSINTNLRLFRRTFVMSAERLWLFKMLSMSVEVNISNFSPSQWHHLITTAYHQKYLFYARFYGGYCFRDVNHTLNIPEEDCARSGTENCYVCCSLLGMQFGVLKYNYTDYTCSCLAEWPNEMSVDYFDLTQQCQGSCSNTSLGFCYYFYNTQGMFIVDDAISTNPDDNYYNMEILFSYDDYGISIKQDTYGEMLYGVSFYSSILYPEWILHYNTSIILENLDYWTSPFYIRNISAKFLRDDNGRVYTKLDFGPIHGDHISLKPSNDLNLTKDIEFHKYYFQKNTWDNFGEDDYRFYYYSGSFMHAPYLILEGFWIDSYLNTTETVGPYVTEEVTTFGFVSSYDPTSPELSTEPPNATITTSGDALGVNAAYSVTQNGQSYQCKCFPEPNITLTADVVEGIKDQIKSNLTVQTDSLSSTTRKKNSAQDDRSSSRTIGCFGIILLSVEFALLIFLDSTYFIQAIHDLYKKFRLVRKK